MSKSNLSPEHLGQFKNPEVQAKAAATRERNRALRTKEAQIAMREYLGEHLYCLKEVEDIKKAWELYKKVAMREAEDGNLKPLEWYLSRFIESLGKAEDREVMREKKSLGDIIDIGESDYTEQ